jgi:hypothetical protein
MSSVDLHTHCGYQTMLAEAVAVVMAPSRGVCVPAARRSPMAADGVPCRHGVFSLHTPDGLSLVQRCPRTGFHAHDAAFPLYLVRERLAVHGEGGRLLISMGAQTAPHVSVVSGPTNYRVVDLR